VYTYTCTPTQLPDNGHIPQNREIADLYITVDVGNLFNWRFTDMKPMTRWIISDSIDSIKYEMGLTKRAITKDEAAGLGAGVFNMRYQHSLHTSG
jgi:hypothetical protein